MSGDEMTREEAEALTEQIRLTSMLMLPGAMQIMGQFVAADLAELEAEIETGLATFMRTGLALYAIRDRRLYADTHDTFEAYCLDRWGFTDRRARQLIDAAETGTMVPVKNERQARALAGLSPADAAEVWEQAVAEAAAAGRAVTAAELAAKAEALAAVDPGKAVVPSAPEEPEGEQGEPGFNLPAPDEGVAGPPPAAPSPIEDGAAPSPVAAPSRPALAAAPTPHSLHPAVGDLVEWWPNPGEWRRTPQFQVGDEAQAFASYMDRREPRTNEDPSTVAYGCPAEFRSGAAIAAKNAAAFWTELAEFLNRPTRLAAVENP